MYIKPFFYLIGLVLLSMQLTGCDTTSQNRSEDDTYSRFFGADITGPRSKH